MNIPRPRIFAKPRYRFPKRAYAIIKRRKLTLTVIVLAYSYFILAGGIYDRVNRVPTVGFTRQGFTIVYQSLNHQFVIEGVIAAFMFFLGALGMRLMSDSIKYLEEPNKSMVYSTAGLLLFLIAFATIEYMMSLKSRFFMRLKLIVTSDRLQKIGFEHDKIAPLAREELKEFDEISVEYLPNDRKLIKLAVMRAIVEDYEIIRVSGGTGLGERDVSVEAVRGLLDKELHAFPCEFLRMSENRFASLGRPIAGRAIDSLVIVSPGSPDAARVVIKRIKKAGIHAVKMIRLKLSGWDLHKA